ncbi:universal stress protein [Bosea sp. (in: a-proteobacteria)]|uniref:universal stress protein n=1 Tax=Bosea sp. (in: a-proteobacteria) TaxID=1871050 RepID=UPI00260D5867|nr:universal stress protein [Bosea sp. (in: a-proteobacteria)]MCO5090318.1 universal stress protein [Bosea sp. (in: a-proteobacteria)]
MASSIKSIFTAYTEEGQGEQESALGYALSLAQQAAAHLTIQAAAMRYAIPASFVGDFGVAFVHAENRRIGVLAERFAELARTSADLAGVTSTIETPRLVYAELGERLVNHARVHDLSVLDLEKDAAERDRGLIEAALFESGRPVIIVPPGCETFAAGRILIAWDGSAGAARTVAEARPFLPGAEVEILSVIGEKDLSRIVAGAELAPHLARHGAKVGVRNLALPGGSDVAEAIRQAATEFRADLIVCGAYKHSRLREWLLGGVTQSLLKATPLPLLMSR